MFYNQVLVLCKNKNISIFDLIHDLKISKSNATNWKNGTVPHRSTIAKIADYFGVSKDFLLSGESSLNKINLVMEELSSYSTDNKQIPIDMEAIKKLSEESQNELFDLITRTVARMREAEEKEKAIEIIKSLPAEDRKAIKDML
jgi:transcriptional regulator with XRE-family HTH domain